MKTKQRTINDQLNRFMKEYNVEIREDFDGIWWSYNSTIYQIQKDALGYYKRYKMDMYRVCKQLTFNSRKYSKTLKSAMKLHRKFIFLENKKRDSINKNRLKKGGI